MKIEGEHLLPAGRDRVWAALNDPEVLARTVPGLKQLAPTGNDTYDATIELSIGPVHSTYQGRARITDKNYPEKMTLTVEGGGRPGTIKAAGTLMLEARDAATFVSYTGDVQMTGILMSVGHRLFGGVAKQLAGVFFKALEREVRQGADEEPAG